MKNWWRTGWTEIKAMAHILHWAIMKPYSLRAELQAIHPDLEPDSNPFSLRAAFDDHPALKRYAYRSVWLAAVVPLLAIVLVGGLYSWLVEPFNWTRSLLFWGGWLFGLRTAVATSKQSQTVFWIVVILFGLISWLPAFFPEIFTSIIRWILVSIAENAGTNIAQNILDFFPYFYNVAFGVAGGVAFGVAGGVAGGVALGVAGGVALGVALGVAFGVALGVALGVAVGVALGVAFGVAFGVAGGVAFGVAGGVAGGVALGVSYILGVLRVYSWLLHDIQRLILLYLHERTGLFTGGLIHMPLYHNELSYLPLPFLDELIAAEYRRNPAAAQRAIEHIILRTNRQPIAVRAMTFITADSLKRCRNTQDVAAVARDLNWLPDPRPPELEILGGFLAISQDVRAANQATSAYQKVTQIEQTLQTVDDLQNQLALDTQQAALFGAGVQQWRQILNTAAQTLAQQAAASPEIPQVYVVGQPLNPQRAGGLFRGRQDLFRELEKLSTGRQNPVLLLYGGRRSGKTSTLRYLPLRTHSRLIPLLVDMQGVAGSTVTLGGFVRQLIEETRTAAKRARNLSLPAVPARMDDPFVALRGWLDEAEHTAGSRTFLLCLDEYEIIDQFAEVVGNRAVFNFLRHLIQHRPRWAVLLAGSRYLTEMPDHWSDYLIGTQALKMTFLSEADTKALITDPIDDFPRICDDDAVDYIWSMTRGQPYLTQWYGQAVVDWLNTTADNPTGTTATTAEVAARESRIFEGGYNYFNELWTASLRDDEERRVVQLAAGERPIPAELAGSIEPLCRRDVLVRAGDGVRLAVPLIGKWVRQFHGEWRP